MKKQYRKPSAKLVDFSYDDQVVAVSAPGCLPNAVYAYGDANTCPPLNEFTATNARISMIGCYLYFDQP